jgi:hypothetical protein
VSFERVFLSIEGPVEIFVIDQRGRACGNPVPVGQDSILLTGFQPVSWYGASRFKSADEIGARLEKLPHEYRLDLVTITCYVITCNVLTLG